MDFYFFGVNYVLQIGHLISDTLLLYLVTIIQNKLNENHNKMMLTKYYEKYRKMIKSATLDWD